MNLRWFVKVCVYCMLGGLWERFSHVFKVWRTTWRRVLNLISRKRLKANEACSRCKSVQTRMLMSVNVCCAVRMCLISYCLSFRLCVPGMHKCPCRSHKCVCVCVFSMNISYAFVFLFICECVCIHCNCVCSFQCVFTLVCTVCLYLMHL